MRRLTYGMNLSLDGYIAAPGDEIGWSAPSDELFAWWIERMREVGLSLYGRKLWLMMNAHWPTADRQPGASAAHVEYARHWQNTPRVVFSSTLERVEGNARLVKGDALAEIARLKACDGAPMEIAGATLAGSAMRAGLIDEYVLLTAPVLVGGGTRFFAPLERQVNLELVETRTFPEGVVLTRYATRP